MRVLRLFKSIVFSLLRAFADALLRSVVVVAACVLLGGLAQHLLREFPMIAEGWYLRWANQAVAVAAPYDSLLSHSGPHLAVSFFSALWSILFIGIIAAMGRLPWKMLLLAIPLLFVWIGWPLERLRDARVLDLHAISKAHAALDAGELEIALRLSEDPAVQASHQYEALDLRARLLWEKGDSSRAMATWDSLAPLDRLLPGQNTHRPLKKQ